MDHGGLAAIGTHIEQRRHHLGHAECSGSFTFTVRVTDTLKLTTIQALSLNISATPLTISTNPTLPAAVIGKVYTADVHTSGGTQPYHWGPGTPPAGLSLDPNTGVLSGTPTATGAYSFTIAVSDNSGTTTSKIFGLTVNAPPLTISTATTLLAGTVGAAYSRHSTPPEALHHIAGP